MIAFIHARRRVLAAAGALLAALLVWYVAAAKPHVEVMPAAGGITPFETRALEFHAQLGAEDAKLDIETSSPLEVRRWLHRYEGISANLVLERAPGEEARFRLRGARGFKYGHADVAAIAYLVDGRRVTLVAARDRDVPDIPRWGLFGKTVRYRRDGRTGAKLLSWRNAGQAYTLVSELPGLGQDACLLCHNDSARRELIRKLAVRN